MHQGNISFVKTIHIMYVLMKGITRTTNCYWHICFFFGLYYVSKYKNKIILSMYFIRYSWKVRRKKLFKKMDSSKKTTVKLSRKIYSRGFYTEEYFWRLILPLMHTCYTGSIFWCILKDNFQRPISWIFCFFSYFCQSGLIEISFN